jgi:tetratricopeptide (TPR) repeat protein
VSRPPEDLRAALEERRRHAQRDLDELAEQVEMGDIDEASARELEAGYRAELEAVEERLSALPARSAGARRESKRPARSEGKGRAEGSAERRVSGKRSARSTTTVLVAMGVAMIVVTALIVIAAGGDDEGPAPAAGGGMSDLEVDVPQTGDAITDAQALVDAHPESNPIRLQLAGAYFDLAIEQKIGGGETRDAFLGAMEQYLFVLGNDPTPQEQSHAQTRVGWMAFETGQFAQAEATLREALTADPANVEAQWFLGIVLLEGMEDPAAAVPVFEDLLEMTGIPEWLQEEGAAMLAAAREAAGGEG